MGLQPILGNKRILLFIPDLTTSAGSQYHQTTLLYEEISVATGLQSGNSIKIGPHLADQTIFGNRKAVVACYNL